MKLRQQVEYVFFSALGIAVTMLCVVVWGVVGVVDKVFGKWKKEDADNVD